MVRWAVALVAVVIASLPQRAHNCDSPAFIS